MAADNAAAWPRDAEIPLTDVRSVPKTGLARPPPTQQTARKERLNFLYAGDGQAAAMRQAWLGLALLLTSPGLQAHPEGAPWGHAGAGDDPTCAACHQGPIEVQPTLELVGLPAEPVAGQTYELTLEILSPGRLNGFQIEAGATPDGREGRFVPGASATDTEVEDTRVRSVAGEPRCSLAWQAASDWIEAQAATA